MKKKKIKIGIVGLGRVTNHYYNLFLKNKIKNAEVISLCDKNHIAGKFYEKKFSAKHFKNYKSPDFYINLDLVWNIGIGFGLLSSNSSLLYNLMSLIIGSVIIILIYVGLMSEKLDKLIYSIIIGGALGNFYDRLSYKAVPDFIDIHYSNFHWFTFNVADIFISIGIIVFIIKSFYKKN